MIGELETNHSKQETDAQCPVKSIFNLFRSHSIHHRSRIQRRLNVYVSRVDRDRIGRRKVNGTFSNPRDLFFIDSLTGPGMAFSADSKYFYFDSFARIFQLNTDTTDIAASFDTVAINDHYAFPYPSLHTDFWYMYLAANGKIYITSGNGVIDMHYIDQPDSDGVSCNVMQHALRLPCYAVRGNVLHPNYYLGPVIGSVCDTLAHVGLQEHLDEVQNFSLMPNPVQDGIVKIAYLLPQNESGAFEVFDLNGKRVYQLPLPPWSTMQIIPLPSLPGLSLIHI